MNDYATFLKSKKSRVQSVGFEIDRSLLIQLAIYPALGIPVKFNQNLIITTVFTLASIGRGYVIRRMFNFIKTKSK
jgi:hypothetical protein